MTSDAAEEVRWQRASTLIWLVRPSAGALVELAPTSTAMLRFDESKSVVCQLTTLMTLSTSWATAKGTNLPLESNKLMSATGRQRNFSSRLQVISEGGPLASRHPETVSLELAAFSYLRMASCREPHAKSGCALGQRPLAALAATSLSRSEPPIADRRPRCYESTACAHQLRLKSSPEAQLVDVNYLGRRIDSSKLPPVLTCCLM